MTTTTKRYFYWVLSFLYRVVLPPSVIGGTILYILSIIVPDYIWPMIVIVGIPIWLSAVGLMMEHEQQHGSCSDPSLN